MALGVTPSPGTAPVVPDCKPGPPRPCTTRRAHLGDRRRVGHALSNLILERILLWRLTSIV